MAKLDLLRIVISALLGAMLISGLYIVQNPASPSVIFISALIAIVMFGVFLVKLGGTYGKLLNKLKEME
ncbi:MAG: hypothetical protein MIO93_11500 [ANME-2 cluster archaeon]|nr:hypothetical protein [ANME-2 cluster archaeon]